MGNPSEECGYSIEDRAHHTCLLLLHPPHFSFQFLPRPPVEGGENKLVVHPGNCRPLCRLSIQALLKFRVVCSGSKKSSIRFLFRTSKAHAELEGSTARFIALGHGGGLLQMTSSPSFPHPETVLLLVTRIPTINVFPTRQESGTSRCPCCVMHTFLFIQLYLNDP